MRLKSLLPALVAGLVLSLAPAALATPIVSFEGPSDGGGDTILGLLGQTFTLDANASVGSVEIFGWASNGVGNVDVHVSLLATDANGLPTGNTLASAKIDAAGANGAWYALNFGNPLTLAAGTYAIVVGGQYFDWTAKTSGNAYAGGTAVQNNTFTGGLWAADTFGRDYLFRVNGTSTPGTDGVPEPGSLALAAAGLSAYAVRRRRGA